ncbi:hypothetical protein CC1G_07038 [Coprinopsis cinerea okayama7|uniref:CxC2-like cysteine cluster KDZ transposase-associated domain-containing protein n=1 Tax=Coprinopsis cinerea (strain Okayama-7 / 130 / ATCC MYA-4618 / FGSC 9003) TaxID=240176 RepID=A8NAY5_COPC7|nr:hypothetical protein CC1G_07038 [Coprinopsis cinerea okayama7\|eukprot:XP_001831987.2 hypothetical protein CC1G_07038 [Coprinopsis cinerea okayama7\
MGFGKERRGFTDGGKGRAKIMHAKLVRTKTGRRKVEFVQVQSSPSPTKSTHGSPSPKRRRTMDDSDDESSRGVFVRFEDNDLSETMNRTKDSNDYMLEWKPKERLYLEEVIRREAPPEQLLCDSCGSAESPTWWRCRDCTGRSLSCLTCIKGLHLRLPLHRVEVLMDCYFSPAWLWHCGVYVSLCANGVCQPQETVEIDTTSEEEEEKGDEDWLDNDDCTFGAKPRGRTLRGMKIVTVIHSNGVHHLPFLFCSCLDAPDAEIQMLRNDFYPSTPKAIRTVFSFSMLDEYLLETLECYTSTHHYYSKIRRLTNEPFPDTVPDRTRELRRVGRQWRRLKELKRNGYGHCSETPGKGDLALCCAACPQPGVNLEADWEQDKDQWKFTRSFVADGNFTCIHRKQKRGELDVYLKNGEGYMVETTEYGRHLATAKETAEPPTCHEHRAIADKSKVRKGLDATGIGAIACMRHGAFVPSSIVDFQKGERHINMDYALSEALKHSNMDKIQRVIFVYDINCQYSKKALERLRSGDYLELNESLNFIFGIGLFHVHGHQEACLPRYSLTFIRGAGVAAGEILESLWAVINEVARSTSTMTLAHRLEVLDAVIGDSNWKKMLKLVSAICKNWKNALRQYARAKEDFDLLNETAAPAQRVKWQQQLDQAQERRTTDVSAMDILSAKISRPPSLAKVRTNLMEAEKRLGTDVGTTSWLAFGLKIQESQIYLKSHIRNLPKEKTDPQLLELSRRRESLYNDLNSLYETAATLFPDADLVTLKFDAPPRERVDLDDDEDSDEEDNPFSLSQNEMEDVKIPLPSSFSEHNMPITLARARSKELELRIAQADDILEAIRTDIGHKSFLYRSNVRLAEGKKQKTRGYAAVNAVNQSLRDSIRVYNQARWAIRRLGADDSTIRRYRVLKPEDTRAVTTIYQPNMRGERNRPLSWIWNLDVSGDSARSEYLEELYRVNWLRAQSRVERWKEEYVLLSSEMRWVLNFFDFKRRKCLEWVDLRGDSPGHIAYAHRQAQMWKLLYMQAEKALEKARKTSSTVHV